MKYNAWNTKGFDLRFLEIDLVLGTRNAWEHTWVLPSDSWALAEGYVFIPASGGARVLVLGGLRTSEHRVAVTVCRLGPSVLPLFV